MGDGSIMTDGQKSTALRFGYHFKFENGEEKKFDILLDPQDLSLIQTDESTRPEWTKLKYSQCSNCPLGDEVEYCPVAVNLSTLVEAFGNEDSFKTATVTVEIPERTYVKKTSLQKALSAIIGVTMVTSGCPIMDKLRPMARFHLPFASALETFFRNLSMYLVAQLLRVHKGKEPDWDLKELIEIYKNISVVNKGMSQRVHDATTKDANVNAIVILHSFGDGMSYFIENGLEEIENFFDVYTDAVDDEKPPRT